MEDLLKKNQDSHFFCDETPIGGRNGISSEFLISFSNKICKQKLFFWLACNSQRPIREVLQRGKQLTLK